MSEVRLDGLMIATCFSEVLDNLDLDKLANAWPLLKTRRIKILFILSFVVSKNTVVYILF